MIYLFTFILAFISICIWVLIEPNNLNIVISNKYPKIIGSSVVVLIGFIALIFGIHSDIYSSYDKFNTKYNQYNWFDPVDIVKFPIDQYLINCSDSIPLETNPIEISSGAKTELRNAIFIIDKTPSTFSTILSAESKGNLKATLSKYLSDQSCKNEINLDKLSNEDLLLMSMIERLSKASDSINISILLYLGNNSIKVMEEYNTIPKKTDLCSFYLAYTNLLANIQAQPDCQTNFKIIFDKIFQPAIWGEKSMCHNIYLISDFEHNAESGTSFSQLNSLIQDYGNFKIEQLNLFKVQNQSNSDYEVNSTLQILRENFNHINYYEFSNNDLNFNSNIVQTVNHMSSTLVDSKSNDPIYLYYLFSQKGDSYDFKGSIQPNLEDCNLPISISLRDRISFEGNFTPGEYLTLNDELKIIPFKIYNLDSSKTKTIDLKLTTKNIQNENYYLEISPMNSSFKMKYPIILRQVLPVTSSIYLITIYTIILILLIFLSFYFIVFIKNIEFENQLLKYLLYVSFSIIIISAITLLILNFSFYKASLEKQDKFVYLHFSFSTCTFLFCLITCLKSIPKKNEKKG